MFILSDLSVSLSLFLVPFYSLLLYFAGSSCDFLCFLLPSVLLFSHSLLSWLRLPVPLSLSLCCLCLVCVFFFTFLTFGLLFFLVGSCWTFVNGLASFSIKVPFLHWQSISVLFALVFVWLAFSTQKIGTSIEVAQQENGVPSRATSRKTDSLNCHLSYKQDLLPDPKVQRNNPLFFQGNKQTGTELRDSSIPIPARLSGTGPGCIPVASTSLH